MKRDSKGRFCKANKAENKEEYQKKLKEAIKFILDCATKKEYHNACSINYTGNKDDPEFRIDYTTYFDLTTLYDVLNNKYEIPLAYLFDKKGN